MPFVIGETRPRLVEVLRKSAIKAARDEPGGHSGPAAGLPAGRGALGLEGPHQRRNAAVAHGILDGTSTPLSARAERP